MHYTPAIYKSCYKFETILQSAKEWYSSQDNNTKTILMKALNHGAGHLTKSDELKAYIAVYGEIHQKKLLQAFDNVPHKVWTESGISVIDYGCGQGIAEMVLSDFMASKYIDNDYVKDFILIEPSRKNLLQCSNYIDVFYSFSSKTLLCKSDKDIKTDDIAPRRATVIHVFSNIIDLDDFDGTKITSILSDDKSHNNVIVCVSPYYQEANRGKRMYDFGQRLIGYTRHYKFEKHIEDWDKPYSCQIHIYKSSYY